jgi:hypothetical protein
VRVAADRTAVAIEEICERLARRHRTDLDLPS